MYVRMFRVHDDDYLWVYKYDMHYIYFFYKPWFSHTTSIDCFASVFLIFFFCMLSGYILFVSRFSTFPFINARCVCGRRAKLCGIWRRINKRGGKTPLFSIPRVCFALFLFKYNYHNSVVVDVQILPKKKRTHRTYHWKWGECIDVRNA